MCLINFPAAAPIDGRKKINGEEKSHGDFF